ncbi:MAG TPA: hypothetical protein VL172_09575 [Kofleriaceae bacterium]|nr:hypothetical protein [Kofleriaceae bacterium]
MRVPALLLLSVAACGGGDFAPPDASSVPPAESYSVTWHKTVPAMSERVECVVKPLGNGDVPVHINRIENSLGGVSHHLIVYKAAAGTAEQDEPAPCDSIENLINEEQGQPLMITQRTLEDLELPEGIAFEMPADQMIRLELHYVNTTEAPIDVTVTSTFFPIADADHVADADLLFVGSPDMEIPPMSTYTLGPLWTPYDWELADSKIFGITGHTHQWGTNVYVEVTDTENGPGTPIYDLPFFDNAEPETLKLDPPVTLAQGGGFRFQCDWANQSGQWVTFGETVDDEMCFFWAYYYPSKGPRTCFHSDKAGSGGPIDVCCPGHQLCNLIDDYINSL